MGRKAKASPDGTDLGPPPDKVRDYPEEDGNIGPGKTYKDKAEFLADVEVWKQQVVEREEKMEERRKEQARLRGKRRAPRKLPSGCQGRKTAAANAELHDADAALGDADAALGDADAVNLNMSRLAQDLLKEGNPGLATLVDTNGPGCYDGSYEYEMMGHWANEALGIEEWDMKDEHIAQWRKTTEYHELRHARPHLPSITRSVT